MFLLQAQHESGQNKSQRRYAQSLSASLSAIYNCLTQHHSQYPLILDGAAQSPLNFFWRNLNDHFNVPSFNTRVYSHTE